MFEITAMQFMVAFFMSIGAAFVFVWAVLSGLFNNIEGIKHQVLKAEGIDWEGDQQHD